MANNSARHTSDNENVVDIDLNASAPDTPAPGGKTPPPILVLSRENAVIDAIRKSAPRGTRVVASPSLDQAAGQLPTLQPGVLVIDTACAPDVAGMVAQLTQHFPDMIVVVAGKSEDSQSLMRLAAAGQIYRFLLLPLSQGQTRLTLEAATNRHLELGQTAERLASGGEGGTGKKNYLVNYIALGAGLVALIGGIWFFMGRVASDNGAPTAETSAAAAAKDPAAAELALAAKALSEGRLVEPAGESALDLYRSALALNPSSEQARSGVRSVADKILERGEKALMSEKLEEAVASVELARDIQPDHSRLPFMDEQIKRERERMKLMQGAEVGNKVSSLLAQAAQRIEQDKLVAPQGESARDSLTEARRLDPTDPAVLQAYRDLAGRIVEAAKQAANAGNSDTAQSLVAAARQMGYGGSALSAVERTLADQRGAAAKRAGADSEIATARKRLNDGQLLEPAGDSAKDHIANVRAADPTRTEIVELNTQLATKLVDQGKQAMSAQNFDKAKSLATAARDLGVRSQDAAIAQLDRDIESQRRAAAAKVAAATQPAAAQTPAINEQAATALKRIKTVMPEMPEAARRKKLEGWVEVVFTVNEKGLVSEAQVRSSSPEEVFDDAAVKAVKQWRFEPATKDGKPVATRSMIRLKF
ncbi:MAG TPA: energy transducer TonB [Steroidobacteraceae bacterium]|nr:energy transducer TonB [Steroidobacteraceae bacterium]